MIFYYFIVAKISLNYYNCIIKANGIAKLVYIFIFKDFVYLSCKY